MDAKTILVVEMDRRRVTAVEAQQVMTEHGCIIKTRLGLLDGDLDRCSDLGVIVLELVGSKKERLALETDLKALPGVKTKAVNLPL